MIKGELKGFEEFTRKLKKLPATVEKKIVRNATGAAIRRARKNIIAATPRGAEPSKASEQYGPLHKNIRIVKKRRTKRGQVAYMVTTGEGFWGNFYELGTRHQPARPFFLPAFRRSETEMIDILRDSIGKGIEKETRIN